MSEEGHLPFTPDVSLIDTTTEDLFDSFTNEVAMEARKWIEETEQEETGAQESLQPTHGAGSSEDTQVDQESSWLRGNTLDHEITHEQEAPPPTAPSNHHLGNPSNEVSGSKGETGDY